MTPSLRPPRAPLFALAAGLAWAAVGAIACGILFMVTRACGYDLGVVARYAWYFAAHVCLPGVVLLALLHRGPVSLTRAIALGIPTGYAVDIFSFLAGAALHAKPLLAWLPVAWALLAIGAFRLRGNRIVRWRFTARHAGLALALAILFLATVIAAASNLFVESPLTNGLPQRPIFHDWVYLVSRAAAIKQHWPLENPSLAGVPLKYHYFMLVHAASASLVTGVEVTVVLLRLMIVPLGFVLAVQAYALGRQVSRRAWGGVLAALLLVAAGELGFVADPQRSVFVGRFVRWLYVSPTFYFGVIFFGAGLLAVPECVRLSRIRPAHFAWLALLGAAATGAKATVVPVLLAALGGWALLDAWRQSRFPLRLVLIALCLGVSFTGVYAVTMLGLPSGTKLAAFDVLHLADFWQEHAAAWQASLATWLPPRLALAVGSFACALVVIAGTFGVRLLAIACVLARNARLDRARVAWLGLVLAVSACVGMALAIDADSELYIFLLAQVPASVLAAAFLVRVLPDWCAAQHAPQRTLAFAAAVSAVALATVAQTGVWAGRQRHGFVDWVHATPFGRPDDNLQQLEEGLLWIRRHTDKNAILIVNTCTAANIRADHWDAVDHTLAGVHYYYSALSERRVLVEGPNYLVDPTRASRRMEQVGALFYAGELPVANVLRAVPCYAVLDRSVRDAAPIALPPGPRVFANQRLEVFRLPTRTTAFAARSAP